MFFILCIFLFDCVRYFLAICSWNCIGYIFYFFISCIDSMVYEQLRRRTPPEKVSPGPGLTIEN